MGFLSRVEGRIDDAVDGAASRISDSPLSPVQIAKKAEKQMRRQKMVGAGKQYAPTLYTVLVSPDDDARLFGYYPTLAGETETYLAAKANEGGLIMDGQPLVRFIVDNDLRHGKFDVIAEMVAAPLVAQLRQEEMEHYGLAPTPAPAARAVAQPKRQPMQPMSQRQNAMPRRSPMPSQAPAAAPVAPAAPVMPQAASAMPATAMGGASAMQAAAAMPSRQAGRVAPVHPAQTPLDQGAAAAYFGDDEYLEESAQGFDERVVSPAAHTQAPPTMVFNNQAAAPVAAPAAQMQLQAYLYDAANDRAYRLNGKRLHIGRESRNEVVIPDINVSRIHAEISCDDYGQWTITDLGSTNGTFVNGRQIQSAALNDADEVLLGTTTLEFQLV